MSYEFTPMSEVEVSIEPAETSHVFIEEGGVVKRAPIDAVGGSKGMVIELVDGVDISTSGSPITCSTINYDVIYETLAEGGTVYLKLVSTNMTINCLIISSMIVAQQGLVVFIGIDGIVSILFTNGSYHNATA